MNKTPYYGKRPNGPYPNNYVHTSYNNGYNYPYKKNNFKIWSKLNNNPINKKYYENRNKSYFYNKNINNSFNNNFIYSNENPNFYHSSVFQRNRYSHRYISYFTEEKKSSEEINNDSVNNEEEKKEVLKIRVNLSDTQCKELVICTNDDISEKVKEFCYDNSISKKLVEPLINKINQSLNRLESINNMILNNNNYLILDKVKNCRDNNEI